MLDLVRLNVFIHAAESLNFSQAAKTLHLSQPTVSHHIMALESEMGQKLFDRMGGKILLTEAGRALLPWARKLLRKAMELEDMMASLQDEIVGQLRIACSTTTGKYILPQFAARFYKRNPRVRVSIMRCMAEHVVLGLTEEDANLGVVSHEIYARDLECQEFFLDHIVLIVPKEHPWASRQRHVEPSELLEVPVIMREPSSGTRRLMLAELAKHDIALDDLDIFLEVGNAEAIVKTVEAGYGVAFISRLAASWALDLGTVVEVKVADTDMHRKVYMVRKSILTPNRATEAFWGFVHDPENKDLLFLAER
jgi:DNA-binding transcriptional LysR family regulator